MFTVRNYPAKLTAYQLDQYLAKGWFRMGQLIFTTRFIFFDRQLYTCIWLRLPIGEYVPKKKLRKLMRRNAGRFRVEYRPARIDPEKELLYLRYRIDRNRAGSDTLASGLLDYNGNSVYDTWEVGVYDGEKLVAFSFFDLGLEGIESLTGVYDPDYAQYSLGIYTMLLEVEFAQRRNMRFYYPGYIVPGYSPFAYKTRIGEEELQYFSPDDQTWMSYAQFENYELASDRMRAKLQQLLEALQEADIPALLRLYPPHDIHMHIVEEEDFNALYYPIFVQIYPLSLALSQAYCIHYDFQREVYVLQQYVVYGDIARNYNIKRTRAEEYRSVCTNILIEDKPLLQSASIALLVDQIQANVTANRTFEKK